MATTHAPAPESVQASVFIADAALLDDSKTHSKFVGYLSTDQQTQLAARKRQKGYRQFLLSRVLVRAALRNWAGPRADSWVVAADAQGRPYLLAPTSQPLPSISVSHSGDCAICALSDRAGVGVDVEQIRPRDIDRLAADVLAESERHELAGTAAAQRLERFYQYWTLKEAYSKALGTGLAIPPRTMVFDLSNPELSSVCQGTADVAHFLGFIPMPEFTAALVLLVSDLKVQPTLRFQRLTALDNFHVVAVEILHGTIQPDALA